ncbi:LPS translocon maturation chaperone LptM [Arenimonas alkanexedens]
MKTTRLAVLLLSLALVAACGTKGDLVPPATDATPAEADAPAA